MSDRIRTNLTVRLLAGEVVVAEADDPHLWHQVLGVITAGSQQSEKIVRVAKEAVAEMDERSSEDSSATPTITPNPSDAIDRWATELGTEPTILKGALDPETDPPYLHVDNRTWEAFRKNYPTAGRNAIPPIVLGATALASWMDLLGLEPPTLQQAGELLRRIHVRVANPTRSIRNCDWLRIKGERVVLNPAQISEATALLRNFATKSPPA